MREKDYQELIIPGLEQSFNGLQLSKAYHVILTIEDETKRWVGKGMLSIPYAE